MPPTLFRTNMALIGLKIEYSMIQFKIRTQCSLYKGKTVVNFQAKDNCQFHISSYVHRWQNTFQKGVDIFRKPFWKIIWCFRKPRFKMTHFISLRKEGFAPKTPIFIEVHVPRQESQRSLYIYVLSRDVDSSSVFAILRLSFQTVLTVWYFFLSSSYHSIYW
jgi:hypothetical protein